MRRVVYCACGMACGELKESGKLRVRAECDGEAVKRGSTDGQKNARDSRTGTQYKPQQQRARGAGGALWAGAASATGPRLLARPLRLSHPYTAAGLAGSPTAGRPITAAVTHAALAARGKGIRQASFSGAGSAGRAVVHIVGATCWSRRIASPEPSAQPPRLATWSRRTLSSARGEHYAPGHSRTFTMLRRGGPVVLVPCPSPQRLCRDGYLDPGSLPPPYRRRPLQR